MPGDLKALQRWFQDRTMRGAVKDAGREIIPSKTLAPAERLAIYADGYFIRLLGALTEDFSGVRAMVGEEGFEKLMRAYLTKYPSQHPSLNFLGARLPAFLDKTKSVKRGKLLRDIAKVEVLMQRVFDAPRAEPLDTKALERIPPEELGRARLRFSPAFALVALEHDVNRLITAVRKEEPVPAPRKKKTWVAVYRKEWRVWRADLSEPQFALLAALERGLPLERAIAASGAEDPRKVFEWFQEWKREGFFTAVELPAKPRKPRKKRPQRSRV